MTEREQLLALRRSLAGDAYALMLHKNESYATSADPILNYRRAAEAAGCHPSHYILGRMAEKLTRWSNLAVDDPGNVADCREEALDIINLAALALYAMGARAEASDAQA